MPTVIMNDVAMEAKVGERLLNVGRRNAAHIGFWCDSAGTCQACRCQVLAGSEHLSPPSEAERAWIPAERLAEGERLACQAVIRGDGEIEVRSSIEMARQMVMNVLMPPPGSTMVENAQSLVAATLREVGDQVTRFPGSVLDVLAQVGPVRFAFPIRDGQRFISDAARVAQRMLTGAERLERPPRVQRVQWETSAPEEDATPQG